MADFVIDQKKIAKNTLFLYSRMFLILAVNFYAVRVILQILGIQDYGIFTIAMGIITMFSILCNAMSRTTQRFLSIAIVKDEKEEGRNVFSISLCFFLIASVILVLLAETVGLYFFRHKIQIPEEKVSTALFVYQMSILCVITQTLTIPFNSSVIAKEKMSFFAKIGLWEAFQTLLTVLLLKFISFRNALIAYSVMKVISGVVIFACYYIYTRKNFAFCRFSQNMNPAVVKEIFHFSGWSLLGATANLTKTQGINILLNIFHGVNFNTTWGVTSQVAGGINNFIGGFQQAFNPEILKSQANEDKESFWKLLFSSSKYSFLLFWFIASPLLMNLTYVLQLWLGKDRCPPQIELFIVFALTFYMFDSLAGPLWTAVEAIGHIMTYQIVISALMIGGVCVSYCLFQFWGFPAYAAMVVNAFFTALCLVYRLFYLKAKIGLSILRFGKQAVFPSVCVTALSLCVIFSIKHMMTNMTFLLFLVSCAILSVCNIFIYSVFGFSGEERMKILTIIQKKLKRA